MAKFCPLASSSAGNSTYISAAGGSLLVDAGVSCRKIGTALAQIGASSCELGAVLLTHEHIDHLRGLRVLLRQTGLPVYATGGVLRYLVENGHVESGATLIEIQPGKPFVAAGMQVTPFSTPHDAVDSVGYRIETPDAHLLAIATDLGHITEEVRRGTKGCELVLLESNYDAALLRMGSYPYFLKQRIASDNGHLENCRSAEFACHLLEGGCTRMVLAHLSRENNSPALARQMASDALRATGASEGSDYTLDVAPYDGAGRLIRF